MENSAVERRLAAVIAMDVVGYSRLMGVDEMRTLNALKAHRAELIDPIVAAHHGRLVKTTGDGLLLEFASVVDAIGCAVAIQRGMLSRNADMREDRRLVFRIGVNIGDIIIDGSDIFGDGVNVAARLEALCEPGGLCISRAANEQIRDKLSLSFADLGEHTVKNIARAIGVFGLSAKDIAELPETPLGPSHPQTVAPASRSFRTPALAISACVILIAGGATWWLTQTKQAAPPPSLEQQLLASLAKGVPTMTAKNREDVTSAFVKLASHRALAVARQSGATWRTGLWPTRELAEEKVLEKCQQFYDEPCAVIAVGETVIPAAADGTWPVRDAPRVRYTGSFNPERVPALRAKDLQRADVLGYAASPSPKAAAFHVNGALHLVTGAASQRAAEEQALRGCNDDPVRQESGGPCYLYAVENRVVLPLRSTAPIAAAAPSLAQIAPAAQAPPSPVAALPVSPPSPATQAALLDAIAKIAPSYSAALRETQVSGYLTSATHRALAAFPPFGSWRTAGWASAVIAEERVLEACQARNGQACVLVAVNDALLSQPADGNWPRRPMARATYDGLFDPAQIPAINDALRQRADVVGYRAKSGIKAAAFHPWGRMFFASGATTQRAAEEQALAECNADPQRNGQAGPCLLYAVVDQVVLPKRSTAPLTAAK